jgi:hypothetical protein
MRSITRGRIGACVHAAAFALSIAAAANAQQNTQPVTPPLTERQAAGVKRVKETIEAINTGNDATIRAYFDGHHDPSAAANALDLYKESLGYDLLRVELIPNDSALFAGIVRRRNSGDEQYLAVRIEPQAPYLIKFIQVRVDAATVNSWKLKRAISTPAPPTTAPAFIDDTTKKLLVDSLARTLERFYTAPDTGRMIGDAVRRAEREGRFRGMDTPAFTSAATDVLRSVNGDKHLRVTSQAPAVPQGGGAPAQAPLNNYGITKVEYLAGNVGYLKQTGPIFDSPEARTAVVAALTYLGNADAQIIDMRGIPGGSAAMVNFLFSHFVKAGTQEVRVINRMNGTDQVRVALETVPGPRRTEVPLYVLVDGKSFSAAEALPFSLQSAGRALVVGEPTPGGGRNNTFVRLGSGLWASVSYTRVSDPRTGREWEGIGVQPDLRVPSNEALEAALAHALERLGRTR